MVLERRRVSSSLESASCKAGEDELSWVPVCASPKLEALSRVAVLAGSEGVNLRGDRKNKRDFSPQCSCPPSLPTVTSRRRLEAPVSHPTLLMDASASPANVLYIRLLPVYSPLYIVLAFLLAFVGAWTSMELLLRRTGRSGLLNVCLLVGGGVAFGSTTFG